MIRVLTILIFLLSISLSHAQSVNNGDFASGSSGWGCSAEINAENVYGGGTSNAVAEVDAEAGLCQTISGFTIGSVYRFSIDYSRRTGGCPGPNPAGANITISNSALSASVSSTVSSYALQHSVFTFTATQTNLTLTIAANFTGSTCGLIIDNVAINLYSGLPIELLYFNATANPKEDLLEWATASEINNDFFTVERSKDGINWQVLRQIKGAGNSRETRSYNTTITEITSGVSYYRLKQTDYDKSVKYAPIVSVERNEKETIRIFPLPATDQLYVIFNEPKIGSLSALTTSGKEVVLNYVTEDSMITINTQTLDAGIYTLKIVSGKEIYYKRIIIVKE
ncbi:MAG: T9SS type A sorting domain-containing protein [Bacteroidota bacterium]